MSSEVNGSSPIAPIETPEALADRVYSAVRQAVFTLDLLPGAPLVERELARRFGISKTPVRDALQRLVGEGLLEQTARHICVTSIDRQLADEIYELREMLEAAAVRLATHRLPESSFDSARNILDCSAVAIEAGDGQEVARLNREFHAVFAENSGNRPLALALSQLQDRVRIIAVMGWLSEPTMLGEHAEHLAVLDAAEKGDAQLAADLMREHVHSSRMRLRDLLPDTDKGSILRPIA
jgi:DNA-binding GntR family transcriptional regulator